MSEQEQAQIDPAILHQHQARRELARRRMLDFVLYTKPEYQPGWVHREICGILDAFIQDVQAKRSPRVMIFLPPGTGKSELVSRRFPSYVLGRFPTWEWITATYGDSLSTEFGRDVRGIIEEPAFQQLFPEFAIRDDARAIDYWRTTKGGKYFATGIGGGTTGKRAHIFDVDDPIKDMQDADSPAKQKECWDWFSGVASTRLYPGGGILITQTLWSLNDTSLRLLEAAKANPSAEQWTVYKFPMIAEQDERHRKAGDVLHPERYPKEEIYRKRATYFANGQARIWHALFQCNPTPDEGIEFKREWFKLYKPGTIPENHVTYMTSDLALSTQAGRDYTVLCAWAVCEDGKIYLKAMTRGRFTPMEIVDAMVAMMKTHKPAQYGVEKSHQNTTIGPFLNKRMQELNVFCPSYEISTPRGKDAGKGKTARAASIRGRSQQGMIYLPDDEQTHDVIIPELVAFPSGHDDVVDNFSMLGLMLDTIIQPGATVAPPEPGPNPDSMEWIRKHGRPLGGPVSTEDRRHVPRTLTGHARERIDRNARLR